MAGPPVPPAFSFSALRSETWAPAVLTTTDSQVKVGWSRVGRMDVPLNHVRAHQAQSSEISSPFPSSNSSGRLAEPTCHTQSPHCITLGP